MSWILVGTDLKQGANVSHQAFHQADIKCGIFHASHHEYHK